MFTWHPLLRTLGVGLLTTSVSCGASTSSGHLAGAEARKADMSAAVAGSERDLVARRADAEKAGDHVKAAYVANELADLYSRKGDFDRARGANDVALTELRAAERAGQRTSSYVDIPLLADGYFTANRVADPAYVREYRNLSRPALRSLAEQRAAKIGTVTDAGALRGGPTQDEAAGIAAGIQAELAKEMPGTQRLRLALRLSYAMLVAAPDAHALDTLRATLRLAKVTAEDLARENPTAIDASLTPLQRAKLLRLAGSAAAGLGARDEALHYYRGAARALEDVRRNFLGEGDRIAFFRHLDEVYEQAILIAVDSDPAEAFRLMELAKGRTLIELLGTEGLVSDTPDQKLIDGYFTKLRALGESSSVDAHAQVLAAERALTTRLPGSAALLRPTAVSPEKLAAVLREGEVFVDYYVGATDSVAVTFDGVRFVATKLGVRRDALALDVEELLRAIDGEGRAASRALTLTDGPEAAPPVRSSDEAARRVFQRILRPIAARLQGTSLVVSPHGLLHRVPFAALAREDGSLLGDTLDLSFAASATLLQLARPARLPADLSHARVLALGNPTFPVAAPPLPSAEAEVAQIGRQAGARAEVFTGDRATEQRFKSTFGSFEIVHLATHGIFLPSDPQGSHVLLAAGGGDDGLLEVREIMRLHASKTKLVVLSACNTERGALLAGDDLIGFNRAFHAAGVHTTITSLWPVPDDATSVLMTGVHAGLARGMSPRSALRAAQTATRARFPLRWHWAAFQVNGADG